MIRPRRTAPSIRPAFIVDRNATADERRAALDLWCALHGVERVRCGHTPDVPIAVRERGFVGGKGPRQGGRKQ